MHSIDQKSNSKNVNFFMLFLWNFQMFLEQQISILDIFPKDHVTEDWSNDAENSAFPSQE